MQVRVGSMQFPKVNEAQTAARTRFQLAVKEIARECPGGVLVVTHGDAVGAIVESLVANSVVYQVDTTGYVVLVRGADKLMVDDADGVSWMED